MRRIVLHSLLIWSCASAALAQVESTEDAQIPGEGVVAPETDPDDSDFIQRINEEMDRRAGAEGSVPEGVFANTRPINGFKMFLRGIFALCIVLALILLAYYGVRKWGKRVPLLAGVSLGSVLGRIHLERGSTLHFVRTGGRVLLVGVNGNSISLVADFEESAFERLRESKDAPEPPAEREPFNPDSFLEQLQASSRALAPTPLRDDVQVDDDEIAALRGDIQRLQQYLREESRETQD